MLSFMDPVRKFGVGVVMGDFNVDANKCSNRYTLQYFDNNKGKLDYVRAGNGSAVDAYPFQRLTGPNLPLQAAVADLSLVLNYGGRLATAKTSISTTLAGASTIATTTSVQGILSSEYDRFFVRAPKPDPSSPIAWNLMDAIVPKIVKVPGPPPFGLPVDETRSTTGTTYVADLATAAARAYDSWWDRQNAKKRKSADTIKMLNDAPKLGGSVLPGTLRQAQYTYRNAVSDHLPIIMELQYA
jgi:hypothetical protein